MAARSQQRLAAAAAAAVRRWMSSSATTRRIVSAHRNFQVRNNTTSASVGGESTTQNGSMTQALEFVKNIKEIFSGGVVEQELSAVKDLSTSVYRLEESVKSQSASFWVLVALLIPSGITVKSTQDSHKAELKRLSSHKEKSETAAKTLENRILALELGNLYAQKYSNVTPSLPAPKVNGDIAPLPPSKVDGHAP